MFDMETILEVLATGWGANTIGRWALGAGATAIAWLAFGLIKSLIARRLIAREGPDGAPRLLGLLGRMIARTRPSLLFALGLCVGATFVELPAGIVRLLHVAVTLLFLVQGAIWGATMIDNWIEDDRKRRTEEDPAAYTAIKFFGMVAKGGLIVVLLLVGLDNIGMDVTALIASLGIGGLAIGLAAKDVLSDLFATMSIIFDKPFAIGDYIKISDDVGGTVEAIGLKTTRLRSSSGEQIIVSNGDLLSARIRNYKRMVQRRVVFRFGVRYETPVEKLEALPGMVRAMIESHEDTRFDRAHWKAYGESSLDFEVVYYVTVAGYGRFMDIQQAVNLELMRRAAAEGIGFAYPTRTVKLERMDAEAVAAGA